MQWTTYEKSAKKRIQKGAQKIRFLRPYFYYPTILPFFQINLLRNYQPTE